MLGDKYGLRRSSTGVLEENDVLMGLGLVYLDDSGTCRFMGGVQNDDLLAGGEFHAGKIQVAT